MILENWTLLQQLKKKVQEAEKTCLSPLLKRFTIKNKLSGTSSIHIEKAFGVVERHDVDITIV